VVLGSLFPYPSSNSHPRFSKKHTSREELTENRQDDAHPTKPRKALPLVNNPKAPLPANAPKGCIFSCEWGKDRRDTEGGNMWRKVNSFVNMAAEIGGRGGRGGMVHGVRSLGR